MKNFFIISSLLVLLSACASPYPLGMNEEQWNKLTPDERKSMLLKQQEHREQQRLVRIKANAEAQKLRLQNQIIETRRLEKLYSNPGDGNVIMVNILGGEYHYGKRQKRILEESYQVARGETKKINLIIQDPKSHYSSNETIYLNYAPSGNGVYLYLDNPRHNSTKRIALLRNGNWQCGSRYTKNLHTSYEKLLGVRVFVKEQGGECHTKRRRKY